MRYENVELLSPAGSFEGFTAVLEAGADAVYLGGELFGARAYAKNFSREEILRAVDLAHLYGARVYLTVNTLLKNRELEETLCDYLAPFYAEGLDAVIVQDFGVLSVIRRNFPGLPVHASTQMTVTGPEGMKLLGQLGVTRVVPARELSLEQIRRMHEECPLEIETFIHGALCYSCSGLCLLSSLIGGRSGNRGRCAQPCRLPWQTQADGYCREADEIREAKQRSSGSGSCSRKPGTGAVSHPGQGDRKRHMRQEKREEDLPRLLSMKDLVTLDILPRILDAGVVSLKIEGRMKQPEYQAGVTRIYRHYLDMLLMNGPEGYRVDPGDRRRLLELFSRGGSCEGYYSGKKGPWMIAVHDARKTTAASAPILPAAGTETLKIPLAGQVAVRQGEPVRLEARTIPPTEFLPYPVLSRRLPGLSVTAEGETAEKATGRALDRQTVRRQLEKLGNTPFEWKELSIDLEEGTFVSLRSFNEIRRQALAGLEERIIGTGRREADLSLPAENLSSMERNEPKRVSPAGSRPPLYASCETSEQAAVVLAHPAVTGIILSPPVLDELREEVFLSGKECYLSLPYVVTEPLTESVKDQIRDWMHKGLKGFLVRSLESLAQLRSLGLEKYCILDHCLYTWNREAVRFFRNMGVSLLTVPLELNGAELAKRDNSDSQMVVYGRQPAMISVQCVGKNTGRCEKRGGIVTIKDRMNRTFPVQLCCSHWKQGTTEGAASCYNIIYNSLPCSLLADRDKVLALGTDSLRLAFTVEGGRQTREVLDAFAEVYLHDGDASLSICTTHGHFRRGAE